MNSTEFDKFADEYHDMHRKNIKLSGESPEFFAEYKIRDVHAMLASVPGRSQRLLDFGSGVGSSVPFFRKYFPEASLVSLDVSERSLAIARERFPDQADYQVFDGVNIPFPDNTFDLVFAACVFHHISGQDHEGIFREWYRVAKPGGAVIVFEHNPLNPFTVHAVNTCPFDENAELISAHRMRQTLKAAGFMRVGLHYRLFVPGALRFLRPLERWLRWCPLGAQYMAYATKPEAKV